MTWTNPTLSLGFIVALVVLIGAIMLKVLVGFPTEWLLTIAALCAIRL